MQTVQFSETFVGILGHDLRNPLGGILTAADLLLRRETNERVTRPIERIRTSAHRMGRMIEQILDFTRARIGGGIPIVPVSVDLRRLVGQLVEELEGAAPQEIVLDCRGALDGEWDSDRLAQAISNLLGNAVEHGETGAPIRVELDGTSAGVMRIAVANAGSIPEPLLSGLFDPFRRASARGAARGSKGLGLGLYVVERIVHAHGGRIEARSSEAEGTSFVIELPRTSRAIRVAEG
jgi:signal transduction histidine kinase